MQRKGDLLYPYTDDIHDLLKMGKHGQLNYLGILTKIITISVCHPSQVLKY